MPCAHASFRLGLLGSVVVLGACGSPPPVAAPPAPAAAIVPEKKEKTVDTSPVPEPPGLVVIGRVNKPEAIVSAASRWTQLPLPNGTELVRTIADDLADVVDLSQPIDAAATIHPSRHGMDPAIALSVAVTSLDDAKAKLGAKHRLVAGANGTFRVGGMSKRKTPPSPPDGERRSGREEADGDDEDGNGCVLAPAPQGARLVCGDSEGLEALAPYLSRNMPREKWTSDVHVEIRPEPVRAPLNELRSSIPILARSLLGSQSVPVREFIDASLGEAMDIVNDAQKLSVDAQVAESGVVMTTRFDFQSNKSTFARMLTMPDRADATPAAFWHLPQETDLAFFGRGSDPKLLERPRELLANLVVEATNAGGMPEAERKVVRDLVADRMLSLFANGTGIYAKGFDQVALERALTAKRALKPDDRGGQAEAKRLIGEQVIGWHLVQVNEPVAKVGPVLKDWSTLWNRPSFSKWVQSKSDGKVLPRMRLAPVPAGVTLPKETVHLEVTIPQDDLEVAPTMAVPGSRGAVSKKLPTATTKAKGIPRKPIVFHVFAVPDGGATWLGFGLDGKLVAQKAATSLASAPEAGTLGKASGQEVLREGRLNGGGFATLRGLVVLAALDDHEGRSAFGMLGSLPHQGATPVVFTRVAEGPSATAKAGSSVAAVRVSRAAIEDVVRLVMASR